MSDIVSTSPEGDTLAAILARHLQGIHAECVFDLMDWPCDAHQLGVALDHLRQLHLNRVLDLDAAEAREARLRAALNAIANNVLTDPREAARAALAQVGSEGTDA